MKCKFRSSSSLGWKFSTRRTRTLLCVVTLCWVVMGPALRAAQSVTLGWDPSPSTNVAGYMVRYGRASGHYDEQLDVGTNTTAKVAGLDEGATYFFAVTAYDANHVESLPSNEVSFLVPGIVQLVGGTGPKDPLRIRTPVAFGSICEIQTSLDLRSWSSAGYLVGTSNQWVELTVPQVNAGIGTLPLSILLPPPSPSAEFFRVIIH